MSIKNSIHLMHPQTQSQHFSLARGLASLGRGSDTNLVHMSDKEINGLKTLAARTGGSLTINPHTGLYEAGWLENILPMVAGGVLAATGVGAPAAALLVAAADTAATKDWKSGLAAGLGAFGGAGIGAGLAGAGAGAAADAGTGAGVIGSDVAGTSAAGAASGATDAAGVAAGTSPVAAGTSVAADTVPAAATDVTPVMQPVGSDAISTAGQTEPTAGGLLKGAPAQAAYNQSTLANNSFNTNVSNMGKGLGQLASNPGNTASDIYASTGRIGLAGLAAPAAYNNYKQGQIPAPSKSFKYYNTTYNQGKRNPYAGELGQTPLIDQGYTSPTSAMYTPITGFAAGGPIPNVHPLPQPTPASTNPVPGPGASQADQIAYYKELINTPSNAITPPSPNAQNQYLQNLQLQLQGRVPTPSSLGGTGSSPLTSNTQPILSGSGYDASTQSYNGLVSIGHPLHGNSTQGTSYNPATQQYNTSGPMYYPGDRGGGGGFGPYAGSQLPSDPGYGPVLGQVYAKGGIASLGAYSDGGNLLRGPGDGMSDSIPAQIGNQKAALANNEFVVPADVVSHLGNGSTDAGSQKLYKMLDRVRRARTGKSSQAPMINADKMLPG